MAEVKLRELKASDYAPLAEMINAEWKFDLYSDKNGMKMALHYLLSCVDNSNVTEVLEVDGKTSGILVIRDMDGSLIDKKEESDALLSEMSGDPGLDIYLKDFEILHDTYEEFAKVYKQPEWSEMRLLILSEDVKGMGLGRLLFNEAESVSRSAGMTGLFFYTDTDCNVGFYDHIGAERICSKQISLMGEELNIFGYRYLFGTMS